MNRGVLLVVLLALLLACDSRRYKIRDTTEKEWFDDARRSALDGLEVSDTTREILRRREMLGLFDSNPEEVARRLDVELRATKRRVLALAIAEVAHTWTRNADHPNRNALGTTLRYSYAYLFDTRLEPAPNRYDIRFRWACDLYNRVLADFVRDSRGDGELREVPLEWIGGSTIAKPGAVQIREELRSYTSFRVAYDFEVEGLPPPLRFEGLGAPCLLTRERASADDEGTMKARYISDRTALPVTFLVRFPDGASILDEASAPAAYEFFDPTRTSSVSIEGEHVPLEMDLTTPVVWSLAQVSEQSPGLKALFRTDVWSEEGGLFALNPLRKDRIPVILIHGLASDPFTWIPLYNDLMADDRIRSRFQFLLWFYPTGQPIVISAAQLRATLLDAQTELRKDGPHPALDSVVLCGHSLGGLLAHYLVVDPGSTIEDAVLRVPLDETSLSDEDKERVRFVTRYDSLPFVKRTIFYATPHRGAPNARKGLFAWLSGFIRLPGQLTGPYARIRRYLKPATRKKLLTSLESLHPESPSIVALNKLPIAPHITYHSIIADSEAAGRTGGSDGFVPYSSSHLDGAASEIILRSGHSVQHRPLAARETKRILLEHLAAFDAAQSARK